MGLDLAKPGQDLVKAGQDMTEAGRPGYRWTINFLSCLSEVLSRLSQVLSRLSQVLSRLSQVLSKFKMLITSLFLSLERREKKVYVKIIYSAPESAKSDTLI